MSLNFSNIEIVMKFENIKRRSELYEIILQLNLWKLCLKF